MSNDTIKNCTIEEWATHGEPEVVKPLAQRALAAEKELTAIRAVYGFEPGEDLPYNQPSLAEYVRSCRSTQIDNYMDLNKKYNDALELNRDLEIRWANRLTVVREEKRCLRVNYETQLATMKQRLKDEVEAAEGKQAELVRALTQRVYDVNARAQKAFEELEAIRAVYAIPPDVKVDLAEYVKHDRNVLMANQRDVAKECDDANRRLKDSVHENSDLKSQVESLQRTIQAVKAAIPVHYGVHCLPEAVRDLVARYKLAADRADQLERERLSVSQGNGAVEAVTRAMEAKLRTQGEELSTKDQQLGELRQIVTDAIKEIPDFMESAYDLPEAVRVWVGRAKDAETKLHATEVEALHKQLVEEIVKAIPDFMDSAQSLPEVVRAWVNRAKTAESAHVELTACIDLLTKQAVDIRAVYGLMPEEPIPSGLTLAEYVKNSRTTLAEQRDQAIQERDELKRNLETARELSEALNDKIAKLEFKCNDAKAMLDEAIRNWWPCVDVAKALTNGIRNICSEARSDTNHGGGVGHTLMRVLARLDALLSVVHSAKPAPTEDRILAERDAARIALEAEVETLKAERDSARHFHSDEYKNRVELEAAVEKLKTTQANQQAALRTASEERDKAYQARADMLCERNAAEASLKLAQDKVDRLEAEVQSWRVKAKDKGEDARRFEAEIELLKSRETSTRASLTVAQDTACELRVEVGRLTEEKKQLQIVMNHTSVASSRMQKEIEKLKSEKTQLNLQLQSALSDKEAEIVRLKREVEVLKTPMIAGPGPERFGGHWLAAARCWIRFRKGSNGEAPACGSDNVIQPPLTMNDVEDIARFVFQAAIEKDYPEMMRQRLADLNKSSTGV